MSDEQVPAPFPNALKFLFEPARYKIAYGGRGSGKTWGFARALIIMAAHSPMTILCAREIQNSMKDSVHKTLATQIEALGLSAFFTILKDEIRGANGSTFIFKGLRHNVDSIKSTEAIDIVWVEEAQTVTKGSWDKLIPTVRKEGSEIWISFNPELDTDETYKRFVLNPPTGAIVRKVNWNDNPWFTGPLQQERLDLQAKDPDAYLTVYEGHCRQVLDGAIYANEMRNATAEGRITKVPYERSKPVQTFWDLGRRDLTAIWFAQVVGFEFRIIDFYECRSQPLDHYLRVMQERGYVYGDTWLPHDAENELLASQRTIAQQMREAGYKVRITPKIKVTDGINAVRGLFPNLWFDADKCKDGLDRVRRYRYDVDDNGQYSREPLHDDNSNAADALRYLAVALREPTKQKIIMPKFVAPSGARAWMS